MTTKAAPDDIVSVSRAGLTHVDEAGAAHMVDIAQKTATSRLATACAVVRMKPETLKLLQMNALAKGDALAVARIAGIMAAKETPRLIPLCHPIQLTAVEVNLGIDIEHHAVRIEATVQCVGATGVEMEALTAVSVAALTLYDMAKGVDRTMVIDAIRVVHKVGGTSGAQYHDPRPDEPRLSKNDNDSADRGARGMTG